MQKHYTKIVFWVGISICLALIIVLTVVYFIQFHGDLSQNISDWANFSTFIYGFSTVALTFLNVCLFYKLTNSANEINSKSQDISSGIIETYTKEEHKRSLSYTGVLLMQEYKKSHAELMQQLNITTQQEVNYKTIRVAVCQLEYIYKILYDSNQIFPSLHNYEHHQEYINELQGISQHAKEDRPQIIAVESPDVIHFQNIQQLQNHHKTVVDYFEEVMHRIQSDLGKVYAENNPR